MPDAAAWTPIIGQLIVACSTLGAVALGQGFVYFKEERTAKREAKERGEQKRNEAQVKWLIEAQESMWELKEATFTPPVQLVQIGMANWARDKPIEDLSSYAEEAFKRVYSFTSRYGEIDAKLRGLATRLNDETASHHLASFVEACNSYRDLSTKRALLALSSQAAKGVSGESQTNPLGSPSGVPFIQGEPSVDETSALETVHKWYAATNVCLGKVLQTLH